MPVKLKFLLFHIYLAGVCLSTEAQQSALRFFDDQDGLPGMTVYGIQEDERGILYMSTSKGICRFNGKAFYKYTTKGLKSLDTPYSFVDNEGTIWYYNLAGEILYLRNDSLHRFAIEKKDPNAKIYSLFVNNPYLYITWSKSGKQESIKYNLFAAQSSQKLNRNYIFLGIKEGQLLAYDISTRQRQFDLYSVEENVLVYSRKIEDGSRMNFILEMDLFKSHSSGFLIIVASNYIRTLDSCYRLISEKYIPDIIPEKVKYISFINENEMFFSSSGGSYFYWHQSNIVRPVLNFPMITNTIYEDRLKRRWISTADNGLILDLNNQSQIYNRENQSMASDEVSNLCLTRDNIFIGHNNGMITKLSLKGNKKDVLSMNNSGRIRFIHQNDHGSFLIGLDLALAFSELNNSTSIQCPGLTIGSIKAAVSGDNDQLYIGSSLGVYTCAASPRKINSCAVVNPRRLLEYRTHDAITFDEKIYAGTIQGLYSINVQNPSTKVVDRDFFITRLFNWNDSLLVICTDGEGLFFLDKHLKLDSLGIQNGLPSANVSDFTIIDQDRFAIGTDNGVYIYHCRTKSGFTINHYDGLPGNEVTSLRSNNEQLFVGTSKGLYTIPVDRLSANVEKPLIEIVESVVFTRSGKRLMSSKLAYNENHIQFKLFTRSLISGNQLKIFYKLKKEDTLWIPAQSEILDFAGLSPGTYSVALKALNEDKIESNIAESHFTIYQPWWLSIWFIASALLSIAGISIWITYSRQKKLRKEERIKQAIQDQINQLREEALQNQMNPHFIFNSLNAIQNFLANNDQLNAMGYLSKFGRLIRMIFEFSKHKRISLESEIEFLQHYLSLESLRFKDKVDIAFNISDEVWDKSPELMIPPLLIQPIIENAFKHGLLHLESGGKLHIDLKLENQQVVCEIKDNGIGREKASKMNSWMKKNRKSSGIAFTKERLELINNGSVKGELNIFDLFDDDHNSIGTKAVIKI